MTIKIERDAILHVINQSASNSSSSQQQPTTAYSSRGQRVSSSNSANSSNEDGDVVVYSPKHGAAVIAPSLSSISFSADSWFGITRNCSENQALILSTLRDSGDDIDSDDMLPGLEESDDDCTTVSSCSFATEDASIAEPQRRVSFAWPLVTEVRTRPRTPPEDLRALFYTYEETQRFRQCYRLEKKLQAQQDNLFNSSPATSSDNACHDDLSLPWQAPFSLGTSCLARSESSSSKHRISRVVVMHQDTYETFYDEQQFATTKGVEQPGARKASQDFFDNDSFWSGSITWY